MSDRTVSISGKQTAVDDGACKVLEGACPKSGAIQIIGADGVRKTYTADGVPRLHFRKTAAGRLLCWGRASVSAAEFTDDAAALGSVGDSDRGWRDVTPTGKVLEAEVKP